MHRSPCLHVGQTEHQLLYYVFFSFFNKMAPTSKIMFFPPYIIFKVFILMLSNVPWRYIS